MNEVHYLKKQQLRHERPVEPSLMSCNELPHFVGHDIESTISDVIPVNANYDNPPFHCEISLYQEYDCVTFRHISARIKYDRIVTWEADGIPNSLDSYYRRRVLVIYNLLYPDGLRVNDMDLDK